MLAHTRVMWLNIVGFSFMKKQLYYWIAPVTLFIVFVVFTVLVKTVDVKYFPIGDNNYYLGFASMNSDVQAWVNKIGSFRLMKILSDIDLYLSFVFVIGFVGYTIYQAVKLKSLKKVDRRYYILLGTYVLVVILYFAFEVMRINYSPIVEDGLKPSYPSTHVFVASVFYIASTLTAIDMIPIEKRYLRVITIVLVVFLVLIMGFVRLLSGRHWMSDIIAGYLLAGFVLSLYAVIYRPFFKHNQEPVEEKEIEN